MEDNKPKRIQFQIGKTSPIDVQEWVENQTLNVNKAVKEVLNHFVRVYGTADILSPEIRQAMSGQVISIQSKPKTEYSSNLSRSNVVNEQEEKELKDDERKNDRKIITKRDINI